MAHNWFGNDVTMDWWNDLWLNESFADFISHYCLENIKLENFPNFEFDYIFNHRKNWGYKDD